MMWAVVDCRCSLFTARLEFTLVGLLDEGERLEDDEDAIGYTMSWAA